MSENNQEHGHAAVATDPAVRVRAIEALLIEKGLLTADVVDRLIRHYEQDVGPLNGAKIVARAWVDPAFKARLLEDAEAVAEELGFGGNHLRAVENTPTIHNVVVCTLCSCYPWAVLGLPPTWYKSFAYRSRTVSEPRAVLREFGLELDPAAEVRVWDSSSEVRYLVVPERPPRTERWSEAELASLVTRDAMIGVAHATLPDAARATTGFPS